MNIKSNTVYQDWWLSYVANADRHCAGLAGTLLRTSAHRRHVVALCISQCRFDHAGGNSKLTLGRVARLTHARLEELVVEWHGSCPLGLIAALGRLGESIETQSFYKKLLDVFSTPVHHDVARALQHVVEINETMLDVAVNAPDILLRTGAFRVMSSVRQRQDVMAAIETIIELTAANPTSMDQSLRELATHGSIVKFVDGWLSKSTFPPAPVPPGGEITNISNASELHRVATEFENCIVSYRLDILCGREAFYECRTPLGPMVARIGRDDSNHVWEFLGTHARHNRQPPRDACAWVESMFAEIGILLPARRPERPERWQVFERLLDPWYEDFSEDLVIDELVAA